MVGGISMERRQPGRPRNAPGHGRLLLWTLGYTLTAFVLLSLHEEAFAAQLVDVRVGEHKGYTRLVLELDSLAAYQVSEPRGDGDPVMRVELDARGSAQELTPSHPIVQGVRVETVGKGIAIHVRLSKAEVQINEMILLSPPRLVFDIRDPAAAAAKRTAKPAVAAKTETARSPAPTRTAVAPTTLKPSAETATIAKTPAEPKVAVTPVVAAEEKPTSPRSPVAVIQPIPVKRPVVLSGASPANVTGELSPGDPLARDAENKASGQAADGEAAKTPPGHPLALDGAATGRPNAMAMPATRATAPVAAETKLAVPPLPSERRAAAARPEAPASSGGDGIVAKAKSFVSGISKIVLAGVGALIVLLLFVMIRRGRAGDDALSPVMSADHLGGGEDDLFGGPADTGATEPVPTARSASPSRPPPMPNAAPAPSDGTLESRVAELENTLIQLTQARENMERQLAAQTEELRVQRAAIARTQRVVRAFGDGDEDSNGATEPVPRVPAS